MWTGFYYKLLSSTKIGSGSIIEAGSSVNKIFPDNVILAGITVKIVRKI